MKRLFPSLPESVRLGDVFQRFPANVRPLMEFEDLLMRGPSDLSVAERELIAAYVSALNSCELCHNAHHQFAQALGIAPGILDALLSDPENADVDDKLRPILAYVEKLTRTPSRMTEADSHAVYDAGWSEEALYDAIQVCAIFNAMNRIVEGTGATPAPPSDEPQKAMESYVGFARDLGVID